MSQDRSASPNRALVWAVLWVVTYFLTRWVLEAWGPGMAPGVRAAMALLPAIPFLGFLWSFVRLVRSADELERRIHLEALALAFPLAAALLMVLGLLQLAIPLPPEDWSYRHVWPFLFLFYFAGLALSRRRYL